MSKINKALDLNKLFEEQKKGKLLKKHVKWPMFGGIKYDGNYTVIIKEAQGLLTYISSGGHIYTNNVPTIFELAVIPIGVYLAERVKGPGKLGDRDKCALRGTRGSQIAYDHKYMVHHYLTLEEYEDGIAENTYVDMRDELRDTFDDYWAGDVLLHNQEEADAYLKTVVNNGWEGIMLKNPYWIWRDTKSRTIDNVKYKGRPTVDLLCVDYELAEEDSKYDGLIGSLVLTDSEGRECNVGSGMSDDDRHRDPTYFVGKVVEIFYERIKHTYIQPTFGGEGEGVQIRHDKYPQDID